MKKNLLLLVVIMVCVSVSLTAMQDCLYIKTNDGKISAISSDIVANSFFLKALHTKYSGSDNQPILIPSPCSIDKKTLDFYCEHQKQKAEQLYQDLGIDDYYRLMDAAEKVKDLKKYISLMRHILPKEDEKKQNAAIFSSHITEKWIGHLIASHAIKKKHTRHDYTIASPYNGASRPQIEISPDGTYFMHDFSLQPGTEDPLIKIYNAKTKQEEHTWINTDFIRHQCAQQEIYFSPNNNFAIVVDLAQAVFFYDTKRKKESLLLPFENHLQQKTIITISSDSKYILCQKDLPHNSLHGCILWCVDERNVPQKMVLGEVLKNKFFSCNQGPVFHPDNKHIMYANGTNFYMYDIAAQEEHNMLPDHANVYLCGLSSISISADKISVICTGNKGRRYRPRSLSDPSDTFLFSIEKDGSISQAELPSSNNPNHSFFHIPNKNMIVRLDWDHLRVLDEKGEVVASHKNLTDCVSALAADKQGNYLVSGYSNGDLIIWDLSTCDKRIRGKKLIGSKLSIKSLTFTDNQLLLSCSQPEMWQQGTGEAILWDMQGNQVINFGNNIHTAKISENGTTIIIVRSHESSKRTVECYNLDVEVPILTLNQALAFVEDPNAVGEFLG